MSVPKTKPARIEENEAMRNNNDHDDYRDELSKDEVLDSFERGFRQMLNGQTRPALEFLDELENE